LKEELAITAARGFAIDDGENEAGVICVGAAISDQHHALAEPAAVSISGPDFRIQPRLAELGELCKQAADSISRGLGLSGADPGGARVLQHAADEPGLR
jgi:DNA-binding IclR family transcriptional regulator